MTAAIADVPIPVRWSRTHVRGAAGGPAEALCHECVRTMMPLVIGEKETTADVLKLFPPIGACAGEPATTKSEGMALFVCLFCRLGHAWTWSAT